MRAKQRMYPSAHSSLCLTTVHSSWHLGGGDDSAMKDTNPYSGLAGLQAPNESGALFDAVEELGEPYRSVLTFS